MQIKWDYVQDKRQQCSGIDQAQKHEAAASLVVWQSLLTSIVFEYRHPNITIKLIQMVRFEQTTLIN
eukprot:3126676-Amphidinium_carterae.1